MLLTSIVPILPCNGRSAHPWPFSLEPLLSDAYRTIWPFNGAVPAFATTSAWIASSIHRFRSRARSAANRSTPVTSGMAASSSFRSRHCCGLRFFSQKVIAVTSLSTVAFV